MGEKYLERGWIPWERAVLATPYLLVGASCARDFLSSCGSELRSRFLILLWERAALAISYPLVGASCARDFYTHQL